MSENCDCHVEPLVKELNQSASQNASVAFLAVAGMGCQNCALRVYNSLLSLTWVYNVEVYLQDGLVVVMFDAQAYTTDDLVQAVAAAGNDGRHHYAAKLLQVAYDQSAN